MEEIEKNRNYKVIIIEIGKNNSIYKIDNNIIQDGIVIKQREV